MTPTPAAGSTAAAPKRSIAGTAPHQVGSTSLNVRITGTINGPPPTPCTASGTWQVNNNLRGTWSTN
jgi:hypothetical protein